MSTITVYSNPNCVQCDMTKRLFTKAGVEFESKMIQDSPEVLELIDAKGYKSAPVVVMGDKSWSGFNPGEITQAITLYNRGAF